MIEDGRYPELDATWFPTLTRMTGELRRVIDLDHSLQVVANTAKHLIPCQGASVRLFDDKQQFFFAVARAGKSVHSSTTVALSADLGVIGWVGRHGRPALINDTSADERFESHPQQISSVTSIICIPLIIGERIQGVIGVTSPEKNAFTHAHYQLLKFLGNCAAPWIELSRLQNLSTRDPLTGSYNRRYLDSRLLEEIARARRHGHSLSFSMVDMNGFKAINDQHGHLVGDIVLKTVCRRLKNGMRVSDVVCRWGGDEFAVVMPETELEPAMAALQRVLDALAKHPVELPMEYGFHLPVTATGGVAQLRDDDTAETLVERADRQMLSLKAPAPDEEQ